MSESQSSSSFSPEQKPPGGAFSGIADRSLRSPRLKRMATAAILVAMASGAALSSFQSTPAAYVPLPGVFSPAWWLEPVEFNSGLRPGGADLHNVFFVSPSVGWAVGYCGTILATTDGGGNWHRQPSGTRVSLWAMHFFNDQQGLVMGDSRVALRTVNGGSTWIPVDVVGEGTPTPSSTFGLPQNSLNKLGAPANAPYESTPKLPTPGAPDLPGSTCDKPLTGNGNSTNLVSLSFADSAHGWVAGASGTIFATADGGQTWKAEDSGNAHLRSISFPTDQLGWAVGNAKAIERTSDGGATWTADPVTLPQWYPNVSYYSVIFPTPDHGWIVGTNGTVLHTQDGGATWALEAPPFGGYLTDAALVPPTSLWVTGSTASRRCS